MPVAWARIGSQFLVYSALPPVFFSVYTSPCIQHSHVHHLHHRNTTNTFKVPIQFHLPTHGSSSLDGHQKLETCPLCTSIIDVLLSLFLCSCVVPTDREHGHILPTRTNFGRSLAVFICTVHDVYNLQLTYITDGNGLIACEIV
jgi:hypothetical protein